MAEKQEHTTNLLGAAIVSKAHPRIELRGQLDELNARIILLQTQAREVGQNSLEADLEELREKVRDLMACEVRDMPCGELCLWGLSEEEIHQRSHHPERYYGLGHILPHADMGRWAAELNLLRTLVRKVELCACRAFASSDEVDGVTRPDFIKVLNRLSSALYILTYKYLSEGYDRVIQFGRKA
ncbi:MAG: hypothetical protein K5841_00610 [Fretibacterium sp.]|nr:hypothetical protein [Fretibacterium sp.]